LNHEEHEDFSAGPQPERTKNVSLRVDVDGHRPSENPQLPIPGTSNRRHLEENVAAAGIELSPEEVDTLSKKPDLD
jgi:hypothetical protein